MSKNQNVFSAIFYEIGAFLQRSKIISFLLLLFVFASCVFLLWNMPNANDLPQLHQGEPVPEDLVAKIEFKCKDMEKVTNIKFHKGYPQVFVLDSNLSKTMTDGFTSMMEDLQRRYDAENAAAAAETDAAAETAAAASAEAETAASAEAPASAETPAEAPAEDGDGKKADEPQSNKNVEISRFVDDLDGELLSILMNLKQDTPRYEAVNSKISAVINNGIYVNSTESAEKADADDDPTKKQRQSEDLRTDAQKIIIQ